MVASVNVRMLSVDHAYWAGSDYALGLFEKKANLYLNNHRSPLLAEKLLELRMKRDAALHGVRVVHTPDAQNAYLASPTHNHIVLPEAPERSPHHEKGPDIHTLFAHHELDELRSARDLGAIGRPGSALDAPDYQGYVVSHRSSEPHVSRMVGSHISPDVILRESNRVAHEVSPETSHSAIEMRARNNEKLHFTFPYGHKHIPEGGREWLSQQRVARERVRPIATRVLSLKGKDYISRRNGIPDAEDVDLLGNRGAWEVWLKTKRENREFGSLLGRSLRDGSARKVDSQLVPHYFLPDHAMKKMLASHGVPYDYEALFDMEEFPISKLPKGRTPEDLDRRATERLNNSPAWD